MIFNRFDPARCEFPAPRLAALPDRPTFARRPPRAAPAKPDERLRHFARGRYALAAAYQLAGIGPAGALLAPAYHCVTMLDPAQALGAPVVLYPLHADLSPDPDHLEALRAAAPVPVRALLATHFFGLPRDFSWLRAWCDAHDIVLVEDCSHVLCTATEQAPGTGIYGRYVVASPYKFFACEDGGLLYSPQVPLPDGLVTRPPGPVAELRGLKHLLAKRRHAPASASGVDAIEAIDAHLAALRRTSAPEGDDAPVERPGASRHYRSDETQSAPLRSSRALVACAAVASDVRRRRANYRAWSDAVVGLPGCRALHARLPDDAVPYMFPLYLDRPSPHFYWLKRLGVPLFRWDEMAVSDCQVAGDYRLHLVHLPCHQSLSAHDMAWLTSALRRTLCTAPSEVGR